MKWLIRLMFVGFLVATVPSMAQIVSTKNKKAIDMYVEADNYRVRFQYKTAIDLLNQAIAKDKDFFEAYLRLELCYKSTNEFKKAFETLKAGLAVTPELRWQKVFWIELCDVGMKLGDYRTVAGYSE